jgi:hypothetical protein
MILVLVAVLATLTQTILWLGVAAGSFSFWFGIGWHLGLSTVLFFAAWTRVKREGGAAWFLLAGGVLFVGPFGAAGALAMLLASRVAPGTDFQEYRRALGPGADGNFAQAHNLRTQPERHLLSFNDVMRWGSRTEKQAALRRIAERYRPEFAAALKLAMRDSVPEIRSEANAAAAAMNSAMELDAQKRASATTEHRDAASLEGHADAQMAIAQSGLASATRSEEAFSTALAAYADARRGAPDNLKLRLKSARALMASGALEDAAHEAAPCLESPNERDEAMEICLESLFALGRFEDIRRLLAQLPAPGLMRRGGAMWRLARPPAVPAMAQRAAAKQPPRRKPRVSTPAPKPQAAASQKARPQSGTPEPLTWPTHSTRRTRRNFDYG